MITLSVPQENNKSHSIHRLFVQLSGIRHFVLVSGLVVWTIVPIVGIIFLLLYCQTNISANKIVGRTTLLRNLLPLVIVLFTTTTYISSFKSFNDTDIYINIYKQLKDDSVIAFPNVGMEPVSFILPKYISMLTQGDELSFLFTQSMTMNIAFTAYSKIFLPEFYPLIILINVMSQGYYFQLFWMRQFYSFIFVVPAIYTGIFVFRAILLYIAFLTHSSSLAYVFILIAKIINSVISSASDLLAIFLRGVNKNIRFRLSLIAISFLILISFYEILNTFVGAFISSSSATPGKLSNYSGAVASDFNQDHFSIRTQIRTVLDYLTISIFAFNADFTRTNAVFFRWLLVFFTMLFIYIGAYTFGLNMRVNGFFFCLPGFFYTIPLYSGKIDSQINLYTYLFLFSIGFRIFYFIGSLVLSNGSESYLTFWDGEALTTPIGSYIYLFWKFLIEGWFGLK